MSKKFDPEMRDRALRMLAESLPWRKNKSAALRHAAGLLGMSPETLRTWARRVEVDQRRVGGCSGTDVIEEKHRLRREVAEQRKANEVSRRGLVGSMGRAVAAGDNAAMHRVSSMRSLRSLTPYAGELVTSSDSEHLRRMQTACKKDAIRSKVSV